MYNSNLKIVTVYGEFFAENLIIFDIFSYFLEKLSPKSMLYVKLSHYRLTTFIVKYLNMLLERLYGHPLSHFISSQHVFKVNKEKRKRGSRFSVQP